MSHPGPTVTFQRSINTKPPGATGTYYPLYPERLLDTRNGNGAPAGNVPGGGTVHLQVTGRGGVPATGVSAVVLNVTVTEPTTSGHITVHPGATPQPTASSLNFVPGWTGANSVTVAVGSNGQVDLYNSAGPNRSSPTCARWCSTSPPSIQTAQAI